MKKTSLALIAIVILTKSVLAQQLEVCNSEVRHKNKIRPCVEAKIDTTETEAIREKWNTYVKHYYDIDLVGMGWPHNKGLLVAENVSLGKISPKKINFYSYVSKDKEGTKLRVFSSFDSETYIDSLNFPEEFNALKSLTADFIGSVEFKDLDAKIETIQNRIHAIEQEISNKEAEIERIELQIKKKEEELGYSDK